MALKIRLARGGSKKRPFYSVVVADARALVDADFGHGDEELLNQGEPSNSTLTVEIAGDFTYEPGLVLRYANKSDLFVFVDHQLVHESGGMLNKNFGDSRTELSLDGLGLTQGQTYDLHIFAVTARGPWGNPQIWLEHPSCD